MFLGGLWHGVSLCYIAWGVLHGLSLALHKVWLAIVPGAKKVGAEMRLVWRLPAMFLTFHIVALGWLLFASAQLAPKMEVEDTTLFMDMLNRIAYNFSLDDALTLVKSSGVALLLLVVGYVMHFLPRSINNGIQSLVTRSGFVGQWLLIVVVVWIVMQCGAMIEDVTGVAAGLPMYADY